MQFVIRAGLLYLAAGGVAICVASVVGAIHDSLWALFALPAGLFAVVVALYIFASEWDEPTFR